jgi:hypothetical protein
MKNLVEKLRYTSSKGVSAWGDLQMEAADAIESLNAELITAETELKTSITRRQEQMAAADFAVNSLKEERDTLRQQLDEAQAEIKRLQVEVCNRNRRALEGDKAEAAFDRLYVEHEELRIQVEASRKQEPVSFIYGLMGDDDYSSTPVYTTPVVADDVQRDALEDAALVCDALAQKASSSIAKSAFKVSANEIRTLKEQIK